MEIRRVKSQLLESNMYLIVEDGHAIVIDPCEDTSHGENLQIDMIIITHEHYDHISGVNLWKQKFSAPLLCSKTCAENIQSPKKNFARLFEVYCELQSWIELHNKPKMNNDYVCCADEWFTDCEKRSWKGHEIELVELPGHSGGSIGILLDGVNFFSGDSLMKDYPVELRFPGGDEKKWEEISKARIESLPCGTHVFPGHFDDYIL